MKLIIHGNCLYVDNLRFCHCEVKHDGNGIKPFSGTVEARFSHHHGRELPIADGIGWLGADSQVSVVLGSVVKSDGSVIPCKLAESRLLGMINYTEEQGKRITLEIERG